jgi:hypothetical protein
MDLLAYLTALHQLESCPDLVYKKGSVSRISPSTWQHEGRGGNRTGSTNQTSHLSPIEGDREARQFNYQVE